MNESKITSKEHLLNFLSNEMSLYVNWIQRKEVAAWTAIIFYVASIWTFYNAFIDKLSINKGEMFFSMLAVILIGYIVFRFIHSQYSSIYHRNAYTRAIKIVVSELLNEKLKFPEIDFDYDIKTRQPKYLSKHFEQEFQYVQPYRGRFHPFKIVIKFWLSWPINFFMKIFRKPNSRNLNNPEIQEAALYSIIIFVSLFYGYLIYQHLQSLA